MLTQDINGHQSHKTTYKCYCPILQLFHPTLTCVFEVVDQKAETLGTWDEMVSQDGLVVILGVLHAELVLLGSEASALSEQAQLGTGQE